MSSADPFSSRFEVFGREHKHTVDEINHQAFEKLKRLLDVGEGGDGRVVLLRAPRAGFGKTSVLQRLAGEFEESHHFVRVSLVGGRTTDAAHVLEYVLQALCQVIPDSTTLTKLDLLARKLLALGLEPLVSSGEVPCQDREGALVALREQPTETFDFHHDRAVTAHWTKSNFEILGPRLAAELARISGASLRESSYWVELLFRFSTTAPDNVERARLLFETVFRGDLQIQSDSAAAERLHGLLALFGTITSFVLIVDDTEGLSTHPPDALALASFLTNLTQCCPGTLVLLSVNNDIWESAFAPLLPGGLADRLTEYDVVLSPLTEEEARELVCARAGERADEVLEKMEWGSGDLYARQVLKAASDAWELLDPAPSLAVVESVEGEDAADEEEDAMADLPDLDDLDPGEKEDEKEVTVAADMDIDATAENQEETPVEEEVQEPIAIEKVSEAKPVEDPFAAKEVAEENAETELKTEASKEEGKLEHDESDSQDASPLSPKLEEDSVDPFAPKLEESVESAELASSFTPPDESVEDEKESGEPEPENPAPESAHGQEEDLAAPSTDDSQAEQKEDTVVAKGESPADNESPDSPELDPVHDAPAEESSEESSISDDPDTFVYTSPDLENLEERPDLASPPVFSPVLGDFSPPPPLVPSSPFAAGDPPPPSLTPLEAPPADIAPPASNPPAALNPEHLRQDSEDLASEFKAVPPEPVSAPADPTQSSAPAEEPEAAQPASPFSAFGRGTAGSEMNLGDVSSIFAPIQPAEEVTLDTENLKPLLEPAEESATPSAFTPGAPPAEPGAPLSAGAPPSESPVPALEEPPKAPPFKPISRSPGDSPFAPAAYSAFQAIGEPASQGADAGSQPPESASTAINPLSEPPGDSKSFGPQVGGGTLEPTAGPFFSDPAETTTTDEDSAAVAGDAPKPAKGETANAESGSTPFAEPASAKEAASEAPQDEPVDTPFKPVALTPTDSSSSPFAKGGPAGLSQRTELPPKKAITAPADQRSPFEPGEAPSLESSPAATTQSPAEGAPFEPADSSPFSTIGSPPSEPPASVSVSPSPTATPSPAPVGSGDSDDQDKVDELLRQFKERYGRK
ncbi:MAG: hypothetical protein VCA37_05915 [Roseibacillus sp.]